MSQEVLTKTANKIISVTGSVFSLLHSPTPLFGIPYFSFVFLLSFETGSYYVALANLELSMYTSQAGLKIRNPPGIKVYGTMAD